MSKRLMYSLIILAVLTAMVGPSTAKAAFAYNVAFTTFIAYQNTGDATATDVNILLYSGPDDTVADSVPQNPLAAGASTLIGVGTLIGGTFNGSAVLTADQPMAATMVQTPPALGNEPRMRNVLLSNGFSSGTEIVMIPTVHKRYQNIRQITKFAVQNAGGSPVEVTIKFFGTSVNPIYSFSRTIQANAGLHVDPGTISNTNIPSGFTGSVKIETVGGSIVAGAMELDSNGYGAKAFEGVGEGGSPVYMPSALCRYRAGANVIQTTYYAIQNTDPTFPANITIRWSNGRTVTKNNVAPYTKAAVSGCEGGNPNGFIGSATITSNRPVIALGKVTGGGVTTAFIGFTSGTSKIALPYVMYANTARYNNGTMGRSNIAVQNIGPTRITGPVTIKYINPSGIVEGTHTILTGIAPGAKVNSNAANAGLTIFGCQNSCTTFGGGVVVEGPAGSQLAVINRVSNTVPSTGERNAEDMNGIPFP